MSSREEVRPARLRIYSEVERARRDASPWTIVQGVLAPIQFLVFLASLALVLRYLLTSDGYLVATWSVVIKTGILYLIMITGSIWEKVVFGKWLFAPSFFWEDVVSFVVIFLHSLYLWTLFSPEWDPRSQMFVALLAYAAYALNAFQFLRKLRLARREVAVAA